MNKFESTFRFKLEAIIQFHFTKHQVRKFSLYISKFYLKLLSSPLLDISHPPSFLSKFPNFSGCFLFCLKFSWPLKVVPFNYWSFFGRVACCQVYFVPTALRLWVSRFSLDVVRFQPCNLVVASKHCLVWILRLNERSVHSFTDNASSWNRWWTVRRFEEDSFTQIKISDCWKSYFASQ